MSATIISGRATRDALIPGLIQRVKALGRAPVLAIIQVGDRPDSASYIRSKKSFGEKIGAKVKHVKLGEDISQEELVKAINECNADDSIDGVIVQLPLPLHLNKYVAIEAIDPKKDVDGLTPAQVKGWTEGNKRAVLPATARGVMTLLKYNKILLAGKQVAVVGRSMLVGKPIAAACMKEKALVNVCHSKTLDLASETRKADIIIVAAGKPGLIGRDHVKSGQVIIDVGINTVKGEKLEDEVEDTKLVGDVDFEAVKDIVAAITPVPGGVGPMTVFCLFENLLDLCEN
jgi:methylenetetrahydrofolate dehydrogenase (NADP+)/methenyltetrahydrofolate cyclohydrolase